jgi:hypothetical protein
MDRLHLTQCLCITVVQRYHRPTLHLVNRGCVTRTFHTFGRSAEATSDSQNLETDGGLSDSSADPQPKR